MTDRERYHKLMARAETLMERLNALGEWNGIRGAGGNGATIHARNLHKSNISYHNRYDSFKEYLARHQSYSFNKDKTVSSILDDFECRLDDAHEWLLVDTLKRLS
jgi:hypothetical protein